MPALGQLPPTGDRWSEMNKIQSDQIRHIVGNLINVSIERYKHNSIKTSPFYIQGKSSYSYVIDPKKDLDKDRVHQVFIDDFVSMMKDVYGIQADFSDILNKFRLTIDVLSVTLDVKQAQALSVVLEEQRNG